MRTTIGIVLFGLIAGCSEETPAIVETAPAVIGLDKQSLVVGESLSIMGTNFLTPDAGRTKLVFQGTFFWRDESGQPVPEKVPAFTIAPVFDGVFEGGGSFAGRTLAPGASVLRWNRFGPFRVPFGATGDRTGTFKGTLTAVNHYVDGSVDPGQPIDVSIEVKPSIVITRLEPIVGFNGKDVVTAGCATPALRGIGGLPYVMEVKAVGFKPKYFLYELSNVNGTQSWTSVTHPTTAATDVLGDPKVHPDDPPIIMNAVDEDAGFNIAAIRVTAVDDDNNPVYTALPLTVVRPMGFRYDGNRELAQYYEPVPVHGPIVGGLGTVITYAESHEESRQRGVSVTVSKSWAKDTGKVDSTSWSQGVGTTQSTTDTTEQGTTWSEEKSASESYGTEVGSSASADVNFSTTKGSDWGWETSQGLTSEQYNEKMNEVFGSGKVEVSASVTGEGSIPGLAKVSGTVGTTVGAELGARSGKTTGERTSQSQEQGAHMFESEAETAAFGSTTTDSTSQSLSGTFGLATQNAINASTSKSTAKEDSVTYEMGGAGSLSENVIEGQEESWEESWVSTSSDTTLLSYEGKIPNGKCAVVYRQTVRYVRRAQIFSYDLCGVRSLVGEAVFNEWSWSPNIALGQSCDQALPPSTQPKAACFLDCE